ncbi:MAG: hypothetical protein U9R39_08085 [Campylobacterota bacterium]|nr:hypothetical protein [Campylobacterota bacterium]
MKNLIIVFVSLFLLLGCTSKKQNIEYKSKQNNLILDNNIKQKDIKKEDISIVDEKTKDEVLEPKIIKTDNIAVVFSSSEIGKYALEVTVTMNTYLLYKNNNFNITIYDIDKYRGDKLSEVFKDISTKNISKVMLMITKNRLAKLATIDDVSKFKIYLPLINSYDTLIPLEVKNLNLVYGAISYKKQFEALYKYSKEESLSEFYDNSNIGSVLHSYLEDKQINYSRKINDRNGEYKYFLTSKSLINSSILLNTPIVKSSILLSQINALEVDVKQILSTQLNYSPFLFTLTQKPDRRKVIIANSIGKIPDDIIEYNNLLNNNIIYNWVNYSTILGVEYLLNDNLDMFEGVEIKDNQVDYSVELYKARDNSFEKINSL